MIGLFDSGVGGLSVLKAMVQNGINEDFIYFGDTKNVPYGTKTKDEILSYTKEIMEFFIEKGASSAVMACNTSSALVYEDLNKMFSDKIKIYPLIQFASPFFKDENGTLGVMATNATVKSMAYTKEISKYNKNVKIVELACQNFVKIVEKRLYDDPSALNYIKEKVEYLKNAGCKKIILGCTHFPYLVPVFKKFAPEIEYIDPANYLIKSLEKDLADNLKDAAGNGNKGRRQTPPKFEFYVSQDPENFEKSASLFFRLPSPPHLTDCIKDCKESLTGV